jgi:hypothetical protein
MEMQIGNICVTLCKLYSYIHLNQCVHWIAFHEVRECTPFDPIEIAETGVTVFESNPVMRTCEGCGLPAYMYRINDFYISAETPSFLCKRCDELLHSEYSLS